MFCRGRLLFDEDLDEDLGIISADSCERSDPVSESENPTVPRSQNRTPLPGLLSCADEGDAYDLDLSVTPSAFNRNALRNCDSGIGSRTSPSTSRARRLDSPDASPTRASFSVSPIRFSIDDSGDEDMNHNRVRSESPLALKHGLMGEDIPPTPYTPPSKKFRSLCLYDTPHTPKSLLQKANRRIARIGKHDRLSTGSKSSLDPEGPQANVNPFTPDSPTYTSLQAKSKSKGLKRVRQVRHDSFSELMDDEDADIPVSKKIALREINTSRYNEEFHEVEKLGDGEFGSVYKCIHRLDGCTYAIKKSKMPVAGSAYERSALNEVYAHAVLGKHQHVVRYYSAWAENDHMYIQNEFCNGGSLGDAITENRRRGEVLSEVELKLLLLQAAHGLKYIHSQHLVHLDIKPGNIFLHQNTVSGESGIEEDLLEEEEAAEEPTVYKIGDLGHVTSVGQPQVEEGDVRYLPQEILREDFSHLAKADIFSLALTVYQAGSLVELPKNGRSWHAIRAGRLDPLPDVSPEFSALLAAMIAPDPALRPSAAELTHHPTVSPMAAVSKAQLKQQLNEQRWRNEILERELETLKRAQQEREEEEESANTLGPAPPAAPPGGKRSTRVVGGGTGKKVNRSMSVTCF